MANGNGTRAVEDAVSYPLLVTEGVTYDGGVAPGGPSSGGAVPLGKTVERALRDALGWRLKRNDPKGFLAALKQSFDIRHVEGHTEWTWTPRTYAVQTDMGALTGAQASIYSRAQGALDTAIPLLDGLYPLGSDFDAEDAEATRSIIRSELKSVVMELGAEGGPRVQRVDQFFQQLLGPGTGSVDASTVSGDLGVLRDRFDLRSERVNTIAEEENYTNLLILIDQVNALRQSWVTYGGYFDRTGDDVFLGTQLVLVSRWLASVAEQAQEVQWVMDSVMMGPAERETTKLVLKRPDGSEAPNLTVAELIRWVEAFATEEGPQLIQDAGKEGVRSFAATADLLADLVDQAWVISKGPEDNPTRGFHTVRVQRALGELTHFLSETAQLANDVVRFKVKVVSVTPDRGIVGQKLRVVVDGENFQAGAGVVLRPGAAEIVGADPTYVSSSQIDVDFDLTGAAVGTWSIVVVNPDSSRSASDQPGAAFIVESAVPTPDQPRIGAVDPSEVQPGGAPLLAKIAGGGFQEGAEVTVGGGKILVGDTGKNTGPTEFVSDRELRVKLSIQQGAKLGHRKITVRNPDGTKVENADLFSVVSDVE